MVMRGIDVTGAVCDFTVFIAMGSHHLCTNVRYGRQSVFVCIVTSVPLFCLPFNRTKRIHSLFFIFLSLFFFLLFKLESSLTLSAAASKPGFKPIFIHAQPTNLKGIHLFVHYCSVARRAQNWFDYTFFYISRHFLTLARAASTYSEHE